MGVSAGSVEADFDLPKADRGPRACVTLLKTRAFAFHFLLQFSHLSGSTSFCIPRKNRSPIASSVTQVGSRKMQKRCHSSAGPGLGCPTGPLFNSLLCARWSVAANIPYLLSYISALPKMPTNGQRPRAACSIMLTRETSTHPTLVETAALRRHRASRLPPVSTPGPMSSVICPQRGHPRGEEEKTTAANQTGLNASGAAASCSEVVLPSSLHTRHNSK